MSVEPVRTASAVASETASWAGVRSMPTRIWEDMPRRSHRAPPGASGRARISLRVSRNGRRPKADGARPVRTYGRTMPRLPDALMDPAAFPHRPTSVELRETHISWVFLAGNRVYKVKKPVRFAFLDYGTVARRRALCAEELRLGRRFAPSVYVGLVAIVPRGPDGLQIAQECDPRASEYAVEMRRYAEADTLRAQLDDGSASAPDLVAAGRAI